jgi:4-amino-4-deoxy-L-arabinose transferase-like glycosyltransferase
LKPQSPLVILLILYVCVAAVYAWATTPLEASDEREHMGMIQGISVYGALPVQQPDTETWWEQEGSQPPLYYLISAALIAPFPRDDWETARELNPHALTGIPGAVGNKNRVLPAEFGGTALAVYVLRAFSIALGAITVTAVYHSARLAAPNRPTLAIFAAGLTAFNPMFLFISASVNNDNLVTALNSVVIYLLLITLRDGFDTRRSLLIAVLVALASLSKLSGLVLVPVIALSALWLAYRRRDLRGLIVLGVAMMAGWGGLAGWWFARNLQLYGELFGTGTMVAVAGARPDPFTLATMLGEFEGFRIAYWGLFGAVNILTFAPFYWIMDLITVVAVIGLLWHLWTQRRDVDSLARLITLILIVVIGATAVILWTAQTYASQGRLLFPYTTATSTLLALGLAQWRWALRWNLSPAVKLLPVGAFALFALIVPFASIRPAYTPPTPIDALPQNAVPVYARFGDVALIGYQVEERRYTANDVVPITLYWQVLAPSTQDYSLYLHAVDPDGVVLGRVDSYPGAGLLRTSTWGAGAIYADRYTLPLDEADTGRFALRIQVGWWNAATGEGVTSTDASGAPIPSVMLNAGAFAGAETLPVVENQIEGITFGGAITLEGYTFEGDQLTLMWRSVGTLSEDYTVFAQVLDAQNTVVGQGDAPPAFPTRYWMIGEQFATHHTLNYPDVLTTGDYRVIIGWYRPSDFARLPTDSPDNAYLLTTFSRP